MLMNLFFGLATMAVCMLVQAGLIVLFFYFLHKREQHSDIVPILKTFRNIVLVMVVLVIGNFVQVVIWAFLFLLIGEFTEIADAVYHSAVNFSSLGYGDIVMEDRFRLLGPLEAINGVLMIGVSTAMLMEAFRMAVRKRIRIKGKVF